MSEWITDADELLRLKRELDFINRISELEGLNERRLIDVRLKDKRISELQRKYDALAQAVQRAKNMDELRALLEDE